MPRMSDAQKPGKTLQSLDLARGAMALLVLISHVSILSGCRADFPLLFGLGMTAVDVFMFVSGFLMYWHYEEREAREPWDQAGTWRTFWTRRLFRIAPLYWLALTAVYLMHGALEGHAETIHATFYGAAGPDRVDRELGLGNVVAHYSFAFGLIPAWASNNALPDWSIGLEMQFYAAFPFVALAIRRFGWVVVGISCLAIWQWSVAQISVGIGRPPGNWGWFPMATFLPLRIGIFFAGIVAAAGLRRMGRGFLISAVVACGFAAFQSTALTIFVVSFVAWEYLLRSGRPQVLRRLRVPAIVALLESRPVKLAADCSYGIYLLHFPILLIAAAALLDSGWTSMPPVHRAAILGAICLPVTLLCAWAAHRWVEVPAIAFGKAFALRRGISGRTAHAELP